VETGLPCVHCGLCLDTCPTYRVLGTEADSPRGRIHIMEAIQHGELELDREAARHLDGCLGCLACESACPSGVSFGRRIEEFRPQLPEALAVGPWRRFIARASASPRLLSLARVAAALLDAIGLTRLRRRLPGIGLLPSRQRRNERVGATVQRIEPAAGGQRVAVLRGCVAEALLPSIHRAATEVLRHNGVEVVELTGHCCGALALHAGRAEEAVAQARRTAAAVAELGVNRVVTTAAGCGAMIRDYAHLLTNVADCDGPETASITRVAEGAMDVSQVMAELGPREPARRLENTTVAYHDACHLLHACGVAAQPRALVRAATGKLPRDLGDNHVCCGSAGSYNLEHPAMAVELGRRKAELARAAGSDTIAVGNIGCILQLERALALAGLEIKVRHPVELLAAAYRLDPRSPPASGRESSA
jgi:glycolate oxidase iron-sulfur subunit